MRDVQIKQPLKILQVESLWPLVCRLRPRGRSVTGSSMPEPTSNDRFRIFCENWFIGGGMEVLVMQRSLISELYGCLSRRKDYLL